MGLVIRPGSRRHEPALMDFVKQDEAQLRKLQVIVQPDLARRDKTINLVVSTGRLPPLRMRMRPIFSVFKLRR